MSEYGSTNGKNAHSLRTLRQSQGQMRQKGMPMFYSLSFIPFLMANMALRTLHCRSGAHVSTGTDGGF
jgi:hypothetical protein